MKTAVLIVTLVIVAAPAMAKWDNQDRECGPIGRIIERCTLPRNNYRVCKTYWMKHNTEVDVFEVCGPPSMYPVRKRALP